MDLESGKSIIVLLSDVLIEFCFIYETNGGENYLSKGYVLCFG